MADSRRKVIRIGNWARFQHYSDRNPPWIKLHREILTSRTWVNTSDASRVLAITCMVLASETENRVPLDLGYIRRRAFLNQEPDFSELITVQFLEIVDESASDSDLLASCHQRARSETETEIEAEKRQRQRKHNADAPHKRFISPTLQEVTEYCRERNNKVDPQRWHDYYTANGWKTGRNPMKDWKAAVRTWEGNGVNNGNKAEQRKQSNIEAANQAANIIQRRMANSAGAGPGGSISRESNC